MPTKQDSVCKLLLCSLGEMVVVEEVSYGIIPIRKKSGIWETFLVKLHSGNHWSFPKGHAIDGEAPRATAERELAEETGLCVVSYLTPESFTEHYNFERAGITVQKVVTYFVAEVAGNATIQEEELDDAGWYPLYEAEAYLTYPEAQALSLRILDLLNTQHPRISNG